MRKLKRAKWLSLLLFALILSNRLVSHQIANRRMGYLLASPNSRRSIAATKRFVIAFQMMILIFFIVELYEYEI